MSRETKRILISGAGPIGLAMALGMRQSSHLVTLVDKKPRPDRVLLEQDTRMIALSKRSVYFLESIDVWDALRPFATAIKSVDISERGFSTSVLMKASEHGLDDFGALVPIGRMIIVLMGLVEASDSIRYLPNTALSTFEREPNNPQVRCLLKEGEGACEELFDWVISAEGSDSFLRFQVGIETFVNDYDQVAVIAQGEFEYPHNNRAYERFSTSGPLALLPMNEREMAIVLVAPLEQMERWKTSSDEEYIAEVMARFDHSLGELSNVTDRHVWKLSLMLPKRLVIDNLVLVGNSAHALHPIAGQGLNLGFRDIEALLPYFIATGVPTLHDLKRFERERLHDIRKVVGATDFLVRAFDFESFPLPHLRNLALQGLKYFPFLKNRIARFGMGL